MLTSARSAAKIFASNAAMAAARACTVIAFELSACWLISLSTLAIITTPRGTSSGRSFSGAGWLPSQGRSLAAISRPASSRSRLAPTARAEAAPGRVATGGPGTGRACPPNRPPRDSGVPRRPHRRRCARRRAAGWRQFQQAEEPLQALPEPGGMQRPHSIDRVDADALAARLPTQQPPPS